MKRFRWLLLVLLATLLIPSVASATVGFLRSLSISPGRVVDLIPLENGAAVLVQSRSDQRDFLLTFISDGSYRQQYSVPWNDAVEPALVVSACETTIHLVMTTSNGAAQYIEWQLPVEVNKVYLPVVCTGRQHD